MDGVSVAAKVIISVIPIVGIVMAAVVVFFYILWGHKEKMLMIKQGSYSPSLFDLDSFCLLLGILLLALGLVLSLVFLLMRAGAYTLLGGLVPLALGTGCLVFYGIHSRRHS